MFVLPKDYRPSRSVESGESFEVIAKVVLQEDGTFLVTEVDGQKTEHDDKPEEDRFDELLASPAAEDLAMRI